MTDHDYPVAARRRNRTDTPWTYHTRECRSFPGDPLPVDASRVEDSEDWQECPWCSDDVAFHSRKDLDTYRAAKEADPNEVFG